jgi:osmotically-inducible protein OsmY
MRTIALFSACVACVSAVAGCSRDKNATAEPESTTELTAASLDYRPSDEELIRRVENAISSRPELSIIAKNAEIDAVNGVVVLRGSVPDILTKREIERIAASVPGALTTLNKLDVRGASDSESDDTISFSIQRALVTDPTVSGDSDKVTIDVNRGIVTLRGTVGSPEKKMAVERVVERTPGVETVMNTLTVR